MFEIIRDKQYQDDGDPEVTRYETAAEVWVELGRLAERYDKVVHIDERLAGGNPSRASSAGSACYATVHLKGRDPVFSAIMIARWVAESA